MALILAIGYVLLFEADKTLEFVYTAVGKHTVVQEKKNMTDG